MKAHTLIRNATVLLLAAISCHAQSGPSVDDLLRRLEEDKSATSAAGQLAEHRSDPRTIPALRSRFLNTQEKVIKRSIALSMIRMGVQDPVYFDFISSLAQEAVDSDAPAVLLVKDGRPTGPNPEFEKWCQAHGKSWTDEGQKQYFGYPEDLNFLMWSHDKRAAPIFRKGLLSNNPLIVDRSMNGLGDLGDPADIEPIIEAADRSKEDIDAGAARALGYYRKAADRARILERLRGTRLYGRFEIAVKLQDDLDKRQAIQEQSPPK